MFLELKTRDGNKVCINIEQIIMIQDVCTGDFDGYTTIHLSGGAVIDTHKSYRTVIQKVERANKRITIF